MMKAPPGAAFEVVEADLSFKFLVVTLDAPAELHEPNQLFCRGVGW
jgi:hypothetical protein